MSPTLLMSIPVTCSAQDTVTHKEDLKVLVSLVQPLALAQRKHVPIISHLFSLDTTETLNPSQEDTSQDKELTQTTAVLGARQ